MNKILIGVLGTLGLGAITGATVVFSGAIDMGADTPHSPAVYRAIEFARERSIASSADDIKVPADLEDAERVRRGAGNYDAMCVTCHLSPDAVDSEIRKGLYPTPPNLSKPAAGGLPERQDARQFWIIKHGIKASGMPAWSKGGMDDEAIWDLVAFVRSMPALSSTQYKELVAASDGHSHGGLEEHGHDHEGTAADAENHHAADDHLSSSKDKPQSHPHSHGKHDHGDHAH